MCVRRRFAAARGTAIGWAAGVNRSGAMLAPIVIGVLVGMALPLPLPLQQNFMAIAIPAVIAVIAVMAVITVLLIDHRKSASVQQRAATPSHAIDAQRANGAGEPA